MENFESYLKNSLTLTEYEQDLRLIFNSAHRRTKVLIAPWTATHSELLSLADLMGVAAINLVDDYKVATENLSEREIANLRLVAKATPVVN